MSSGTIEVTFMPRISQGVSDESIGYDNIRVMVFDDCEGVGMPSASPEPTPEQTPEPTPEPTQAPTPAPTPEPTPEPTLEPTPEPTPGQIPGQTPEPTPEPTQAPTPAPTFSYPVPPNPGYSPCNVCGPNHRVATPDLILDIPKMHPVTCEEWEFFAMAGYFPPEYCLDIRGFATPCGCVEVNP